MPTLNWLDRAHSLRQSAQVPCRILRVNRSLSHGDADSGNLLIQGDNLHALKALMPYFRGQVKCVYIDPPFNTQQAFDHYDDGVKHSVWLDMMCARAELLRELLSDDGTFFVHIDDNELAYLVVLLDEIFGRSNRISVISFKQGSATGHKSINPGVVSTVNFILMYAKNKAKWKPNRVFTAREKRDDRYGQFIENHGSPFQQWRFVTLASAFSKSVNLPEKGLKKALGDKYEKQLYDFVLGNSEKVIQLARPDYNSVSSLARNIIDQSKAHPDRVFLLRRDSHADMYFVKGQRILFYRDKLKLVDGQYVTGEPLTSLWDDILSNNLHNEGGVDFPKGKKPEALIKRCLELATNPGDLVLDSFLGSGTTAAVAHKMHRRYIGIEMGEHARTHCAARLKKVIEGEQGGISKAINWQGGGGFRFYTLGAALFAADGTIHPDIKFAHLAAYLWFFETRTPWTGKGDSPLLGIHNGTAYYLLYNGILKDNTTAGGNILTASLLRQLPAHEGKKVIYALGSRLSADWLAANGIQYRHIPHQIPRTDSPKRRSKSTG